MAGLLSWIGRSVDDLVKMGYPESVAKRISSGELQMDYASRMERAKQLGYDVANPEYRGGGLTQIENPEALFDKGLFSTSNPSLAATYANARNGGNTMPVLLNREGTTTIQADGTRWNDINNSGRSTNDYVARVKNYDLPSVQFKDVRDIGPRTVGYPREVLQDAFEPSNVTATLDPTKVRSLLSAAFDPEYRGSNILGSAAGLGVLGGLLGMQSQDAEAGKLGDVIKAYHGSPHSFDKFSMSKLGTGEGAQAYGHGLYFAQNEDVAKAYRDNLSGNWQMMAGIKVDGKDALDASDADKKALEGIDAVLRKTGSVDGAIADLERRATTSPVTSLRAAAQDKLDWLNANKDRIDYKPQGNMYEVGINLPQSSLLDWDKPISQQPPEIRQTLIGLLEANQKPTSSKFNAFLDSIDESGKSLLDSAPDYLDTVTGENLYRKLAANAEQARLDRVAEINDEMSKAYKVMSEDEIGYGVYRSDKGRNAQAEYARLMDEREAIRGQINDSWAAASDTLNKSGIGGIQYLDGASRGAGEGTRNYVVFDDKNVDILKKYLRPETAVISGLLGASALTPEDAMAMEAGMPAAMQAAGQSDLSGQANLGRELGSLIFGLDMLLPLVGEAFKPAMMGNAELTDEQRRRGYFRQGLLD